MNDYDRYVREKTSGEVLSHTTASDQGPLGQYLRAAALVLSNQEIITAQNATSGNLVAAISGLSRTQVDATNALVASQAKCTRELETSIGGLTKSIVKASDDSGKLGKRIVVLTVALVAVGLLQATATAWPYLAWWWHHLWS